MAVHSAGRRRVALVTGCSRRQGIGAAICRALAAGGVDLFFTYWTAYDATMPWGADMEGAAALQQELDGMGVRSACGEVDLASGDAAGRVLDAAERALGPLSILVNNATHSTRDGYAALDAETLDAHYAVNMRATMLLCTGFARRFTGSAGGRIINLTSGQSLGPMPDELAYAATKGAIESFSLSLSAELATLGITVNAVNPGPNDTGWMTAETREQVRERSPSGRIGTPADAARLVAFLASDAAAWITGQVIHSEGGFLRR